MADVNLFLRKRNQKGKQRAVSRSALNPASTIRPAATASAPPQTSDSQGPSPASQPQASSSNASSPGVKGEIMEIKLYSTAPNSGLRYNMMKLNSLRDVDPTAITPPILMNRKQPGPKQPPQYAFDEDGKLLGRFVYDTKGAPILDEQGRPTIERREEMDMSLVGTGPGGIKKKSYKKGTKEVFHQDKDIIRLRREETDPWVLESGNPKVEKTGQPDHWVGRMMEPSTLPTVLFVNTGENGFSVYPLGRTYRFEPDRPFKVLDSDAAHKLYEQQAKYKVQDRWGLRPDDSASSSSSSIALPNGTTSSATLDPIKTEIKQEQRAMRMEQRIYTQKGVRQRATKVERFDDDYKAEKRQMGRGMEGEADEELDYDVNEDFQDDEENNTFYRDENDEEEAKVLEERLKKEFRLANVNVGDKPQIEDVEPSDGDDDDDLFGDPKLTKEGKKLAKMMKKRRKENESDEDVESSDSESDSDTEMKEEKAKPSETSESDPKKNLNGYSNPNDNNRSHSNRGTSSPTGRRPIPPSPGKAQTAPPGSGSALLAQRAASRGASPHRSRAGSPLARGNSPEMGSGSGRAGSPVTGSGSRQGSPAPSVSGGTLSQNNGSSGSGGGLNRPKHGKRKTTSESPLRDSMPSNPSTNDSTTFASSSSSSFNSPSKRKTLEPSPTPSATGSIDIRSQSQSQPTSYQNQTQSRKKKKSSSATPTPGTPTPNITDIEPFEGMITQSEIVNFFRKQGGKAVPMAMAITAFRDRIVSAGPRKMDNQNLFLKLVKMVTDSEEGKMLRMKKEFA